MSGLEISTLLLSAGIGGAIGAALAVLVSGARLTAAWNGFSTALRAYLHGRNDPESEAVRAAFGHLDLAVQGAVAAFEKLRRALRLK